MAKKVSIAKARRTLGTLAENLGDDQVRQLINSLHLLAREQLLYNGSKVDEKSKEPTESSSTA